MNIHPGPANGTRFGYFRCFANRFRLPRESLHQVPVAFYWTLGGFSYPPGTQNLLVTESHEDEHQILSTTKCNDADMQIAMIKCDGEFTPLFEEVKDDLNIDMNCASAKEHVPEAERNNRVIQERVRATCHRLPCHAVPRLNFSSMQLSMQNKRFFHVNFPKRHDLVD